MLEKVGGAHQDKVFLRARCSKYQPAKGWEKMIIRKVDKAILEKEPYQLWNAFVDLLTTEEYDNLDEIQRIAYLTFWYDAEVNNGGHLQYFENRGTSHLADTINALKTLGAAAQAEILKEAGNLFLKKKRRPIKSVFAFVRAAKEGEFDEVDDKYYECEPSVQDLLEAYLEKNKDHFVEIV